MLVGRRSELRRLQAALDRAKNGSAGPIQIAGEAGVGKTRLVNEFASSARSQDAQVRIGGCVRLTGEMAPFAPIVEALRPLARELSPGELASVLGPNRRGLAWLLPDLNETVETDVTGVSPDTAPGRLFELALGLVSRLAARAPLILVLEDIQWADRSTLELLAFLARNVRGDPILLVTTMRTDEPEPRGYVLPYLAEMGRHPRAERIDLERLSRREVADQLTGILGRSPEAKLVDRVFGRSQGNAFFCEELLAAGALSGPLPQTLHDVLSARLTAVGRDTAALVRVASAAGHRFSEDLLAAVSDMGGGTFRAALHEALDHQILIREVAAEGELLSFRHALMQELVYADLLPSERSRLHAACATRLEDGPSPKSHDANLAAELAYHWQAADDPERALRASIVAGLAAQRAGARAEAVEQFERAIAIDEGMPVAAADLPLDRVGLLEQAAAAAQGDPSRALGHIGKAIDLVDPALDPVRAGELRAARGRYHWLAGDGAAALSECRAAVELVPAYPPSLARARVVAGLAQILNILGRSDEAVPLCREAVELAAATGARAIESHALNTLGTAMAYLGDVEGGLNLLHDALAIAHEVGSRDDVDRARVNIVDVLVFVAARFDEGAEIGLAATSRGRPDSATGIFAAMTLVHVAAALYLGGRWGAAEAAVESVQLHDSGGIGEIMRLVRAAQLDVSCGRFEEAERGLAEFERLLEGAIDLQWIAPALQARAEFEIWTGKPEKALQALANGLDRLRPAIGEVMNVAPLHALGVRAAADQVRRRHRSTSDQEAARDEGARYLQALRETRDRIASNASSLLRLVDPYLALAEAEGTRLAQNSDPASWTRAAELLDAVPLPYPAAYARYREAEALLAGRHAAARSTASLQAAHVAARSMGAEPLRLAIEDLAARGRIDLTGTEEARRRGERPAGLSKREQEILNLVAAGWTNRQIGQSLFITEKTASHHVSNILTKLGVADRTAAAAEAIRLGITRPAG
jgi:DNA-binding CsgD family transcriptional regulator/tetratricopeptide (TPR) repeat protein